jgi:hypothetical protein
MKTFNGTNGNVYIHTIRALNVSEEAIFEFLKSTERGPISPDLNHISRVWKQLSQYTKTTTNRSIPWSYSNK